MTTHELLTDPGPTSPLGVRSAGPRDRFWRFSVLAGPVTARVWRVALLGPLDDGSIAALQAAVDAGLAAGATDVLLDLGWVRRITSGGAAACVVIAGSVHKAGGSVVVLRPTAEVRRLFETIGLGALLHPMDNLGRALRHLSHARRIIRPGRTGAGI